MHSELKSFNFPELDWVLTEDQKIIIFCATIASGFRVACYIWCIAEKLSFLNRGERIRMYNALNWASYNTETLAFLNNNPDAQITIATDSFSVGIDSPAEKVVIFGRPVPPEDYVPKFGRIRRPVRPAQGIFYLPRGSMKAAQTVVEANSKEQSPLIEALDDRNLQLL
jgi:superfamily II DNA/RNA helicase